MEARQIRKEMFKRIYYVWNPKKTAGPLTNVVDTIIKLQPKEKN